MTFADIIERAMYVAYYDHSMDDEAEGDYHVRYTRMRRWCERRGWSKRQRRSA